METLPVIEFCCTVSDNAKMALTGKIRKKLHAFRNENMLKEAFLPVCPLLDVHHLP